MSYWIVVLFDQNQRLKPSMSVPVSVPVFPTQQAAGNWAMANAPPDPAWIMEVIPNAAAGAPRLGTMTPQAAASPGGASSMPYWIVVLFDQDQRPKPGMSVPVFPTQQAAENWAMANATTGPAWIMEVIPNAAAGAPRLGTTTPQAAASPGGASHQQPT